VYYSKLTGGEYIYPLLYVDDMLIAFKSRSAINKLNKDLFFAFEMKDLDEAKKVLGVWTHILHKYYNISTYIL